MMIFQLPIFLVPPQDLVPYAQRVVCVMGAAALAEAMAPLLQRRKPLTGLCIVLADQTALASFLPTKHVFV